MSRMATPESSKSRADPPTPASTGSESSPGMQGPFFPPYGVNATSAQQQPPAFPAYSRLGLLQQPVQPMSFERLTPTWFSNHQYVSSAQQQQHFYSQQVPHQPASPYTAPLRNPQCPNPQPQLQLHHQQYPYSPQSQHQRYPYSPQWQRAQPSSQYGSSQAQRYTRPPPAPMSAPPLLHNVHHGVSFSNPQNPQVFQPVPQRFFSPPPPQPQQPYASQPAVSSPLHAAQNMHNQGYALQSFYSPSSANQQPLSQPEQQAKPQLVLPGQNPSVQSDPMSLPPNVAQQSPKPLRPSDAIVNHAFGGNNVDTINMEAFKNFLSDLGVSQPTDDYFRNLLDHTGALNNGMMTRQVFCCVLPKVVAYSAFVRADPEGKGELKPAMFRAALKLLGIDLEENGTYYYVGQADRDRDRAIDLEEFVKILPVIAHDEKTDFDCMVSRFRHAVWQPVQSPVVSESCPFLATPTMASRAFDKVVGEKDSLNLEEFKEALMKHMCMNDKNDDLMERFTRADTNHDGRISKSELIGMVNNAIASQSSGPLK